ncbi:MAG TPA: cyclic nucleotide-binding domain-containing protein [bacterium]|nr:cyclic nucleotide-binding domain-containing protein [bacterium]
MESLFAILERKLVPGSDSPGVWGALRDRLNPSHYRPKRDPEVEVHAVDDRRRPPYFVLKHPHYDSYARLSADEEFLWRQMEGARTVKDLILAYFTEFGSLAIGRVAGLVTHLRNTFFLEEKPRNLFVLIGSRLPRPRLTRFMRAFVATLTGKLFQVRGVDRWVDRIHRYGGFLLYTRPAQALSLLLVVVGGVLFVQQVRSGQFSALQAGPTSAKGIALMFGLNYVAIFIHELAHALTCRHYGAKVNGAGFLLYLGIPAFFVDTTDIWTKSLRARLATTWAGPYSGLILAGLISVLIAVLPGLPVAAGLHRLAMAWVLILVFNLIPFVELDGYYMLVDWLDIPKLRTRAQAFVRRDLWRKLRHREPFTRLERLFTGFGILSLMLTVVLILLGIAFWQSWLGVILTELWEGGIVGRLLIIPVAFVVFVPLLVMLITSLARSARAGAFLVRRWWARPRPATLRDRIALLNNVAFLASVPDEVRAQVAQRLQPVRVRAGETVFRQGQTGDAFYIIRRGQAEVAQARDETEKRLALLGSGEHFGEIALLGQTSRTATVRGLTDLDLLALRKGDFERLFAGHLSVSEAVERAIAESEDLRHLPLFSGLSADEVAALSASLRRERHPTGAEIVRQGEVGDRFYVVHEGQAEVIVSTDGKRQRLRVLGPGDYFGEIALLLDVPRTATVRALTPLEVFSLGRADFEVLLQSVIPQISREATARREVVGQA